jgi:hypothetical protein
MVMPNHSECWTRLCVAILVPDVAGNIRSPVAPVRPKLPGCYLEGVKLVGAFHFGLSVPAEMISITLLVREKENQMMW